MIMASVVTEANKALVRRFVQQVFEKLRPEAVDELVADDFISYTCPENNDGKAYLRQATERLAKALSNIRFVIDDMVAEGDRVAVRLPPALQQPATSWAYRQRESATRSVRCTSSGCATARSSSTGTSTTRPE